MKQELAQAVAGVVKDVFNVDVTIELTRPEEKFGDFATNVALQLSKQLGQNPREIAEQLAVKLRETLTETIIDASVAGPGFLNLTLTDTALLISLDTPSTKSLEGKIVVAEYSDPNPFKVLHAGHLYTSIVGDAIANLLERAGGNVHRVNFGGDVGLHVAKTMWAILKDLGGAYPDKLQEIPVEQRSEWLTKAYIEGTRAYDEANEAGGPIQTKIDIIILNKIIYTQHIFPLLVLEFPSSLGADPQALLSENIIEIYKLCREWSYDYFKAFYKTIGTEFEKYYPESTVADLGLNTVKEQLANGVFQESDGAVIFKGEEYGLHTRVFINREGIPTYEAKDVGLIMQKREDYHFDRSVVITGNEQQQYMAVVLKAVEQFEPELVAATSHLTHGIVKLQGGVKMSSRKGNILRAVDVLEAAAEANQKQGNQENHDTVLGAVKYAFLKNRIGGDVIYDPIESVSLEGNSGPYLQYAHARAKSILTKSTVDSQKVENLEGEERTLVRKLSEYSEVVDRAITELMPHHICGYLYELAQTFNRFYEHNRVIDDPREAIRLSLITRYADTLKDGLNLLGITAPDRM
jgi:arginyl-tRNA synthetase